MYDVQNGLQTIEHGAWISRWEPDVNVLKSCWLFHRFWTLFHEGKIIRVSILESTFRVHHTSVTKVGIVL